MILNLTARGVKKCSPCEIFILYTENMDVWKKMYGKSELMKSLYKSKKPLKTAVKFVWKKFRGKGSGHFAPNYSDEEKKVKNVELISYRTIDSDNGFVFTRVDRCGGVSEQNSTKSGRKFDNLSTPETESTKLYGKSNKGVLTPVAVITEDSLIDDSYRKINDNLSTPDTNGDNLYRDVNDNYVNAINSKIDNISTPRMNFPSKRKFSELDARTRSNCERQSSGCFETTLRNERKQSESFLVQSEPIIDSTRSVLDHKRKRVRYTRILPDLEFVKSYIDTDSRR